MKQFGLVALGLAGLAALFGGNRPPAPAAPPTAAEQPTPVELAARAAAPGRLSDDPIRIDRDASGQFHLDLAVNAAPTRFLIDTGADGVALTEADARKAGIAFDPAAYQPILQTASGQGWGIPVRLDRLEIGHADLRDIDAVVVRDLGVSLLGQSVLRRLGGVQLMGDQIVLNPNS